MIGSCATIARTNGGTRGKNNKSGGHLGVIDDQPQAPKEEEWTAEQILYFVRAVKGCGRGPAIPGAAVSKIGAGSGAQPGAFQGQCFNCQGTVNEQLSAQTPRSPRVVAKVSQEDSQPSLELAVHTHDTFAKLEGILWMDD